MAAQIARRLLSGILLLFALTLVTFVIYYEIPADPGKALCPDCTASEIKAIDHRLGVDESVLVQYGNFIWRIVRHGDLGQGFNSGSVNATVRAAAPITLSLVVGGALVLLLLSFPLALLSALKAQTVVDRAVLMFSILGIALHPFVVGAILRGFFNGDLHVLPHGQYCPLFGTHELVPEYKIGEPYPAGPPPTCGGLADWSKHLLLPWLTFACFFLPLYVRMIRARLLETLGEQYVVTARAKGASELRILRRHVLKNALLPITTMLAMDMGTALTAAIYVETVFGLPGLGLSAIAAISGANGPFDLPVILAIVFVVATTIVVLTLLVDLAYGFLDPRIRLRREPA